MQYVEKDTYERDINFHKLFLKKFTNALNHMANKKMKLCFWIISNMKRDNLLPYSYRQISEKTGISYATVAETMKELLEKDFLRRYNTSHYMINPDIIFKGTYQNRCITFNTYCGLEKDHSLSTQERELMVIQKNIANLQKKEKALQQQIDLANSLNEN